MPLATRIKVDLSFGFALLIILAVGIFTYRSVVELRADQQSVMRAERVLLVLEESLSGLKDAETGQRGYLLTRQERFLAPYLGSISQVRGTLDTLAILVRDPGQRAELATLRRLSERRMALLDQTVEMARGGDFEGAIAIVQEGTSKTTMDAVRRSVEGMKRREFLLLQERREEELRTARQTVLVVLLGSLLAVLVVAVSRQRIVADLRGRERAEAALAANDRDMRGLYDIVSSQELTLPAKLSALLEMGCHRFGLPLGVLSHVHDDLYEVTAAHDPAGGVGPGDVFPLQETYCSMVVQEMEIKSWENVSRSDISHQPCYARFGLETYLGTPVVVNGEMYGALCFAASEPRAVEYTESDKNFLRLMSQWIGGELERNLADQSIRESEQRFRGLSEAAMEGIAMTQNGRIVDANRAFGEIFGVADGRELVGRSPLELVAAESREEVEQAMTSGREEPYEAVAQRADGSRIFLEVRGASAVHLGRPARITALRDVTVRRRIEQVMRDSEERYRSLVEAASDMIYRADLGGKFTYVNPVAVQIMGHPAERLHGMNYLKLIREDARAAAKAFYSAQIAGDVATTYYEFPAITADGREVWIGQNVRLLHEDGRVVGIQAVARDITQRREVERMKDEFLSVVSHELRTPLTAIRGSLGLLASGRMGTLEERGQRMLEIAAQNTDRLVRLINDLLDFEKIASGKATMERRPVEAAELVQQALEAMSPLAEKGEVRLEMEPIAATLSADPDRVAQVLANVLGNAIKFSDPGGTIRVAAERRGAELRISVSDEGRGIPADKLEAIFERFQQVDSSDARQKGGTGLGLPIARTIVRQHGGEMWVESRWGAGSTFHFTLPLAETDGGAAAAEDGDAESPLALVCDDDAGVRALVRELLQREGYRVRVVATGEEALAAARVEPPSVVLLDLGLPGVGGGEVVSQLRQHPATARTPVVVLTASGEDTGLDVTEIVGWVTKPIDRAALLETMRWAVTRDRQHCHILLVEDNEDLAGVIMEAVAQRGLACCHARTGREAIELSRRIVYDLLMLDPGLPDLDGFAVVDWLRRHNRHRSVPLLVYTARELTDGERDRLRLGPTEFMTKTRVSLDELDGWIAARFPNHAAERDTVPA